MSRDLEHKTQGPTGNENVQAPAADQDVGATTKYSAGGPLPPVAGGGDVAAGPTASERAFGAEAYARGNDIQLGNEQRDQHLAHEATHVVQQ